MKGIITFLYLLLISNEMYSQLIFQKCFTHCGAFPATDRFLYAADIVQDSAESYAYLLFNENSDAGISNTYLCKIDSSGNNIILKSKNITDSIMPISVDTNAIVRIIPQRILRFNDNQFITISLFDSSVVTAAQTISAFSWVIIASYDSSLNLISSKKYFLGPTHIQKIENFYLKATQLQDTSGFIIAATTSALTGGAFQSIITARFDVYGNLINAKNYYLNGINLKLYDINFARNNSIFILLKIDSMAGAIKLDGALNPIWSKEFYTTGGQWNPDLLNLINDSTLTIVSKRGQFSSEALVFNVDTSFSNISSPGLLTADSTYFIDYFYECGSLGVFAITNKRWGSSFPYSWQQDFIHIDSNVQLTQTTVRSASTVFSFKKVINNKKGFLALSQYSNWDVHFGEFADVFYSQLGTSSESCWETINTLSPYYFLPIGVNISSASIQDSAVQFIRDSASFSYGTVNIFYYTDCTGQVDILAPPKNILLQTVLYPNPFHTTAKLEIETSNFGQFDFEIRVYNSIGSLIRQEKITNINSYTLQRGSLSEGLYFYEFRNSDYSMIGSGKFVIE